VQAAQGRFRKGLPRQLGEWQGGGDDLGVAVAEVDHASPCATTASPSSWAQVIHFDDQQEAQARRAKYLHKVIGEQAATGAGSLTGKAQS
jgi:hypothetical protein